MTQKRPSFFKRLIQRMISFLSFQNGFNWRSIFHPNTCVTNQCERTAIIYLRNMKEEIKPCENFYEYACGNYNSANPIPKYYNAISALDSRLNEINENISEYLVRKTDDGPPVFHRIKQFYQKCMDEGAIRQSGFETLKAELALVDLHIIPPFGTDVKFGYKYIRTLAKIHRYSVSAEFLFDVSVQIDPKSMRINRIFFGNTPATSQASMNTPTDSVYNFAKFTNVLNGESEIDKRRYNDIREALKTYISKVVTFMYEQTNQAVTSIMQQIIPERIEKVTDFLLELEKTRKIGKYTNVETILRGRLFGIQRTTNLMDNFRRVTIEWSDYFTTLFTGIANVPNGYFNKEDPIILIGNGQQFEKVLEIVSKTRPEVFVSAMWWAVVQSLAPVGPKHLQEFHEEYLRAVYRVDPQPRQLICLNMVRSNFPFFVGHILAKDRRSKKMQTKKLPKRLQKVIKFIFNHQ